MNILEHRAVKQLVDGLDAAAIADLKANYSNSKYDGYGPDGYGSNTGYLRMSVNAIKNEESKIQRTIAIDFSAITGTAQDFNLPEKVTVTEILPQE